MNWYFTLPGTPANPEEGPSRLWLPHSASSCEGSQGPALPPGGTARCRLPLRWVLAFQLLPQLEGGREPEKVEWTVPGPLRLPQRKGSELNDSKSSFIYIKRAYLVKDTPKKVGCGPRDEAGRPALLLEGEEAWTKT